MGPADNMNVIIGRESGVAEPRLSVKTGNKTKYIGTPGSVPKSVSRSHCAISIEGDCLSINNVSEQNVVYVNGMEYKSKSISPADVIELGPDRYALDLQAVLNAVQSADVGRTPEFGSYDIKPLKQVWNDYTQAKLDIQIRERKIGALSAVPGVISMISIALSFIEGLRVVFIAIAAVFALVFAAIRIKSAGKVPMLQKELEEKFQDNYVCPHCSHFLGNQRYEVILRNGGCPWCKSKFRE